MGKLLLTSVVLMSVVIGAISAKSRRMWPGLFRLLGLVLLYDVFYVTLIYYLNSKWAD